jgi:hypothetical protein
VTSALCAHRSCHCCSGMSLFPACVFTLFWTITRSETNYEPSKCYIRTNFRNITSRRSRLAVPLSAGEHATASWLACICSRGVAGSVLAAIAAMPVIVPRKLACHCGNARDFPREYHWAPRFGRECIPNSCAHAGHPSCTLPQVCRHLDQPLLSLRAPPRDVCACISILLLLHTSASMPSALNWTCTHQPSAQHTTQCT